MESPLDHLANVRVVKDDGRVLPAKFEHDDFEAAF
jgi:hypothetical protein